MTSRRMAGGMVWVARSPGFTRCASQPAISTISGATGTRLALSLLLAGAAVLADGQGDLVAGASCVGGAAEDMAGHQQQQGIVVERSPGSRRNLATASRKVASVSAETFEREAMAARLGLGGSRMGDRRAAGR